MQHRLSHTLRRTAVRGALAAIAAAVLSSCGGGSGSGSGAAMASGSATTGAIQGSVASSLAVGTTLVSAQQDGAAVGSVRPDVAGNFTIAGLQPGTYTLVIQSEGRATGVVTGVPVSRGATVSSGATPITLPDSDMADITGAVAITAQADGGATEPSTVTSAEVRATQSLAGGESVQVASAQIDGTGTYHLAVPKAAPLKAAYAASGALAFTADAEGAGAYSVDVVMKDDSATAP